jgi:hypothetical protein
VAQPESKVMPASTNTKTPIRQRFGGANVITERGSHAAGT